jgi:hypothetical protein
VLPKDWADDKGPEFLSLPDDLAHLFDVFLHRLAGREPLEMVLRTAVRCGATQVMLERDYIDADYRSEFANFYAETFRPLPDRCQRLHFFDPEERQYFGFSVMRPIIGRPVSRSVIAPPPPLRPHISCLIESKASPYGYLFTVRGFPFISQDYQYGRCAHAAIWMVAHYFHLRFARPRYYVSDIVEASREPAYLYRHTPSSGLTHPQMNAALDVLGMPAINYILEELPAEETPETVACRYLNSGLPVIVLGDNHARVLIGYGAEKDGTIFFICNDDARGPYRVIQDARTAYAGAGPEATHWERLVVPTPGRIYLAGEAAEREGGLALKAELGKDEGSHELLERFEAGKLRLRSYVTDIASYKRRLRERNLSPDVVNWHARASSSHWVWVVELQDRAAAAVGPDCVVGEVAIDATSDDIKPNFLFANLPGRVMRWAELGAQTQTAPSSQTELYRSGSALHVAAPV